VSADERMGAADVLERIQDGDGNPGVLAAHYTLEKTSAGWRITTIEFKD
jgi:hypothetical protein